MRLTLKLVCSKIDRPSDAPFTSDLYSLLFISLDKVGREIMRHIEFIVLTRVLWEFPLISYPSNMRLIILLSWTMI